MTTVSTPSPRPYVPAHDKSTVPPVPKRAHLVTRSPSPPYYHAAASDALPSSRAKPSHSFSESQLRSNPLSSTSDLVPPHLRPTRTSSFWRRHWFVILVSILAASSISVAVTVVLRSRSAGVYIPPEISAVLASDSEASIGTESLGSATSSIATTSASATKSVPGGPLPSPAPTKPS